MHIFFDGRKGRWIKLGSSTRGLKIFKISVNFHAPLFKCSWMLSRIYEIKTKKVKTKSYLSQLSYSIMKWWNDDWGGGWGWHNLTILTILIQIQSFLFFFWFPILFSPFFSLMILGHPGSQALSLGPTGPVVHPTLTTHINTHKSCFEMLNQSCDYCVETKFYKNIHWCRSTLLCRQSLCYFGPLLVTLFNVWANIWTHYTDWLYWLKPHTNRLSLKLK